MKSNPSAAVALVRDAAQGARGDVHAACSQSLRYCVAYAGLPLLVADDGSTGPPAVDSSDPSQLDRPGGAGLLAAAEPTSAAMTRVLAHCSRSEHLACQATKVGGVAQRLRSPPPPLQRWQPLRPRSTLLGCVGAQIVEVALD